MHVPLEKETPSVHHIFWYQWQYCQVEAHGVLSFLQWKRGIQQVEWLWFVEAANSHSNSLRLWWHQSSRSLLLAANFELHREHSWEHPRLALRRKGKLCQSDAQVPIKNIRHSNLLRLKASKKWLYSEDFSIRGAESFCRLQAAAVLVVYPLPTQELCHSGESH